MNPGQTTTVSREQRFTKGRPCPICGGYDTAPRGQSVRCHGFMSSDGEWAHCSREEFAGAAPYNDKTKAYIHKLTGDCKCGARHGFPASGPSPNGERNERARREKGHKGRIVKTYDYRDEGGNLLYQTVRFDPKDFRQRQPNPAGGWTWNLKDVQLVLYRLQELLAADKGTRTLVCAGEKDTDTAAELGFLATTNPLGEGKWRHEYSEALRGRPVAIIAHNDEAGRKHAEDVAHSLHGKAASVKVINLPGVPEGGGDLTDWTDAGGTREELERLIGEAPEWSPPPSRGDAAWATCEALARQKNLTALFADALKRSGVAGESNQVRLLYLSLNSRHLDKPVSVAVKGPSSGGKSHLVERVVAGFPESAVYELTSMSEKALIYLDEDMRHRFLVIYEASGMEGDMQTYLIRSLLSENRIRYQTAESTPQGVKPRLLEMEGPTGLMVTTTRNRMHPENETRLLSIYVTDTRLQTKEIFRALAEEDREEVSLEGWKTLQTWIEGGTREVSVPFGRVLAEMVPPLATRLRRDFGAVLRLIKSHALLHRASRETDDKGRIVATLEDYAIVRELIADLVSEGVGGTVRKTVKETVQAVAELTRPEEVEDIGIKKIADKLKLDRSTTQRRVKAAADEGYLVNEEDQRGKAARWCLGEPMPADVVVLPARDALQAEYEGVQVCNDIGGETGGKTKEGCATEKGVHCTPPLYKPKTRAGEIENPIDTPTKVSPPSYEPEENASWGRGGIKSAHLHTPTHAARNGDDGLHTPHPLHTPEEEKPSEPQEGDDVGEDLAAVRELFDTDEEGIE